MKIYRCCCRTIEATKDQFWNIVWFCRNVWFFRDQLKDHRHWDYSYCLDLFIKSLERLADTIEGYDRHVNSKETATEIRSFCLKLEMMKNPYDYVEAQLGYKPDSEVYWADWQEAADKANAKGQKYTLMPKQPEESKKYYDECRRIENEMWEKAWADFNKQARGWWD